jgi:HK97 family phage prohead protease
MKPLVPEDILRNHPDAVPALVRKQHATESGGPEYVLGDESIDRHGDQILAARWDVSEFRRNSICLFNHQSGFPVGRWTNVRVEGNRLVGKLVLAPEGTSPRIDEIRKLVDARVLCATSVGFRPVSSRPHRDGGVIFEKQILVECSIVRVPSNPNCVQIAKSLGISEDVRRLVFTGHSTQPNQARSVIERLDGQIERAEAKKAELLREQQRLLRIQRKHADDAQAAVDHIAWLREIEPELNRKRAAENPPRGRCTYVGQEILRADAA